MAGETPSEGACRELLEETGIKCSQEELQLSVTKKEGCSIYKSYILVKEIDPDMIRCQENETVDARFVSRQKWLQMVEEGDVAKPIARHYFAYRQLLDAYFSQEEEV